MVESVLFFAPLNGTQKEPDVMILAIPLTFGFAIWFYFLMSGVQWYSSIQGENIDGFPNAGQTAIYVFLPAIMCIGLLLGLFLVWKDRYRLTLCYLSFLAIIVAMPYILISRGGV